MLKKIIKTHTARGEMAPHVFLLTCLLPTYGDYVFMLHEYQPEYQELMAAKPRLV